MTALPPDPTRFLYAPSAVRRIKSAAALSDQAATAHRRALLTETPDGIWPAGFPTSINPMTVVIADAQAHFPQIERPRAAPTVAEPHPGLTVSDPIDWHQGLSSIALEVTPDAQKIRALASVTALVGLLDLSDRIDPVWAAQAICHHLRPLTLIAVGLGGDHEAYAPLRQHLLAETAANRFTWVEEDGFSRDDKIRAGGRVSPLGDQMRLYEIPDLLFKATPEADETQAFMDLKRRYDAISDLLWMLRQAR